MSDPTAPYRRAGQDDAAAAGARARALITEADVRAAHDRGRPLDVPADALLTPAAQDAVRLYRVAVHHVLYPAERGEIAGGPGQPGCDPPCHVALGADHGGYPLKTDLKGFLESLGHHVADLGTFTTDAVDYPDFAYAVGRAVADGRCDRGIVIDAAGIGSAIAANKVPGVRAANCRSLAEIQNSREHNDANVLSLGARFLQPAEARDLVRAWLAHPFAGGRHQRRIDKIREIEARHLRPTADVQAPAQRRTP
ncbi:MAG: ribose 5-phosphate isomerase B [Planctomycetes bacterium]|nr:ribose 5-phosphate isomerase B [Planctomycetota bacterium]